MMFTDLNDTCGSKAYDCLLLKLETVSNQSLSIDQFKASIPLLENVFLSHLLIEANGSKRQFGKANGIKTQALYISSSNSPPHPHKVQISHPWAQTIVKCHAGYLW